ncbi:MAG: response regulator receiver protein, partial [Variovorax sp.]|nr:response regulator receiver protein [Variovorax sp.]
MTMNVLIVDDNHAAAELLQELLELDGHTVRCAFTGREALEAAGAGHFPIALIDLSLPDLPGTEVARRLREANPGGLLVAVSGFDRTDVPGADAPGLFDHFLR